MDCEHFRSQYSDFADDLLDERAEVALRRHMAECPECRRLHAAYRAGCDQLRALRCLAPSAGFRERLSERIGHEAAATERSRSLATFSVAVAVALAGTGVGLGLISLVVRNPDAATAQAHAFPFTVPFAGDTSFEYHGRFPVIPVSRDSFARRPVRPPRLEVTVDWMQP